MKLRVLICLVLALIIISDVTVVAATHYKINVEFDWTATEVNYIGSPEICFWNYVAINDSLIIVNDFNGEIPNFTITYPIDTITLGHIDGYSVIRDWDVWVFKIVTTDAVFRIYHRGRLVASGSGLGTHILNLPCPSVDAIIPIEHALNFTLAAAMAIPTMTVDIVDDIMLIIGRHIKCGIAKFAIRAALLKFAAKGVAIATAITAVGYLFSEFADDIYEAIFINIPEINPGDTHFHEIHLHDVMDVIDTYYPLFPHIRNDVEESIRLFIDEHGLISITGVMEIIRNHQNNTVIDIYQETPEILPENLVVNREQVPEIMDLIDIYFPVELPIRNIIEQEIYRRIDNDEFNEIPFSEVIDIIEEEQNIFIPEVPVETPEEHQEYIDDLIDRVIYEDPYIPTIETPFIFPGIPATPTTPRTPKRPNEKIHTFPFYSIFVDPLAAVIGITLAHLFTAMMIIGAIISIGATWGTIGAIFAGFIGTITTAYFGLTSWLIPVFLIILLIIYANIKIKGGGSKD